MTERLDQLIPAETELVILLCRTSLSDKSRHRCNQIVKSHLSWELVFSTASDWEVEPVVLNHLRTEFLSAVPQHSRDEVFSRERAARALALTRGLVTLDLTQMLSSAGISSIVVKGAALAVTAYGDASLRTYSDIDLLGPLPDIIRAKELLIARGYAPYYSPDAEPALIYQQHALELTDGLMKVELHSALLSRHLLLDLNTDEVWESAERFSLLSGSANTLARHHLLLYLCAHGAKHQWGNPRWICDVAHLLGKLTDADSSRALDLAGRAHANRILSLGVSLAQKHFAAKVPAELAAKLVTDRHTRSLADNVSYRLFTRQGAMTPNERALGRVDPALLSLVYWSKCRERLRDRIGSLALVTVAGSEPMSRHDSFRLFYRFVSLALRFTKKAFMATVTSTQRGA